MKRSAAEIPQFAISRQVSWNTLNQLRNALNPTLERSGVRLTLNDFILQAMARALMVHKELNGVFVGDPDSSDAHIKYMAGAHIGLVIAIEEGLLVPVLHGAEKCTLKEIALWRVDATSRTNQGGLRAEELSGASISLSNLGKNGPDRFTAMIKPGESAILAVGRSVEMPRVEDGQVLVRSISEFTLTVDHRLTDGKKASDFLQSIVDIIEGRDWHIF
jgi:pyruvate dehydrogenase E2 component (dihydrolipoamide acetyltransferase)